MLTQMVRVQGFRLLSKANFNLQIALKVYGFKVEYLNSIHCSQFPGLIGSPLTVGAAPHNDYNLIALQQQLLSLQQQQLLGASNLSALQQPLGIGQYGLPYQGTQNGSLGEHQGMFSLCIVQCLIMLFSFTLPVVLLPKIVF